MDDPLAVHVPDSLTALAENGPYHALFNVLPQGSTVPPNKGLQVTPRRPFENYEQSIILTNHNTILPCQTHTFSIDQSQVIEQYRWSSSLYLEKGVKISDDVRMGKVPKQSNLFVAFDVEGFVVVLPQRQLDLLQSTGGAITSSYCEMDGREAPPPCNKCKIARIDHHYSIMREAPCGCFPGVPTNGSDDVVFFISSPYTPVLQVQWGCQATNIRAPLMLCPFAGDVGLEAGRVLINILQHTMEALLLLDHHVGIRDPKDVVLGPRDLNRSRCLAVQHITHPRKLRAQALELTWYAIVATSVSSLLALR